MMSHFARRTLVPSLLAVAAATLMPDRASASLSIALDTQSNGTVPSSGAPWVTLLFQDHSDLSTITSGQVQLTISVSGTPSGVFTDTVAFNVDPTSDIPLTFSHQSGAQAQTITQNATPFQPGSGNQIGDVGNFNVEFDYTTANNSDRLNSSHTSVYLISSSSVSLSDSTFNKLSVNTTHPLHQYLAAAHLQGYGSSAGIVPGGTPPPHVVPEPSTLAMAFMALAPVGVAIIRRRRRAA